MDLGGILGLVLGWFWEAISRLFDTVLEDSGEVFKVFPEDFFYVDCLQVCSFREFYFIQYTRIFE